MKTVEPVFAATRRPFRATVVIVLYRLELEDSPAFRTVMEAREMLRPRIGAVDVFLWDNSPTPLREPALPDDVHYRSDPDNSGLAQAYNRALEHAIDRQSDWMITLDQDTAIPSDFFVKMASAADAATQYAGVGAIVSQIEADGRIVSPNSFLFGAIPRWYPRGFCGVPREPVFAFNSGSMLSVSTLQQVGGYDPWFWLDHSDAQIFSRLHQHGKRVFIAGNIRVHHEFSMKNLGQRMSLERYRNSLLAESAFWDLRMNRLAGLERTLRLTLRLIKHRIRKDSSDLQWITREAIRRRLFQSRTQRTEEWREMTRQRLGDVLESSAFHLPGPRVSACMAAFNGARFVDAQLHSIVSQLRLRDEVVIVDDCSHDDTAALITACDDSRVRLLRHTRNAGVVATFEDALRSAAGDFLFLCDDDDVWAPTKLQRFLHVFDSRPEVQIVTSRVRLIDEEGRQLPNCRVNREGRFLPGFWKNIYKNHYQGSAMAMRASLLSDVLPFPRYRTLQHDSWIGTRIELVGGATAFIDEDLLFYRRHTQNASQIKNRLQQLRTRLDLLLAHVAYALRLTTK